MAEVKISELPNGQIIKAISGTIKVQTLANPVSNSDAATKGYADSLIPPSLVHTVSGNIVDNTDPANPAVTQVQTNWNASSGLGQLLNKPNLGSMAFENLDAVNMTGGTIQATSSDFRILANLDTTSLIFGTGGPYNTGLSYISRTNIQGVSVPCLVATTGNLDAAYDNGPNDDGINASLTNTGAPGHLIVDGIDVSDVGFLEAFPILVWQQTDPRQNGFYTVYAYGVGPWVLYRARSFATNDDLSNQNGALIEIMQGDTYKNNLFVMDYNPEPVVGTDPITFTHLNVASITSDTSITAAGTDQSTATPLTANINIVTSVASGTGVKLPPSPAIGTKVSIYNFGGGEILTYYSAGSETVNGVPGSIGFAIGETEALIFEAASPTAWVTQSLSGMAYQDPAGILVSGGTVNGTTLGNTEQANAQFFKPVKHVTATTYTVLASDCSKLITFDNAAAVLITLPQQSTTTTSAGFAFEFINLGAGELTFQKEGSETLIGTITVPQYGMGEVFRDTTTQWAVNFSSGSSSGSDPYWLDPVRLLATTDIIGTYYNGPASDGVGATLTGFFTGTLTIDGKTIATGDSVLLLQPSAKYVGGIYTVTNPGGTGVNPVLTRRTDYDNAAKIITGTIVLITDGDNHVGQEWWMNQVSPLTIGTDDIVFTTETINGLGTISTQNSDNVNITGGRISGIISGYDLGVVQAASTSDLDATYNNGSSGEGSTLVANNDGALIVDDYTVSVNEPVLVLSQINPYENGIYVCIDAGSISTPFILERASYYDSTAEILQGTKVFTVNGSTYRNANFYLSTQNPVTVGTTDLIFFPSFVNLNPIFDLGAVKAVSLDSNLSATYVNGSAGGIGSTLTSTTNGTLTLDSEAIVSGEYVGIFSQTSQLENGLYLCVQTGDGSNPWILQRAAYFDSPSQMQAGAQVIVLNGARYGSTQFFLTASVAIVGISNVIFETMSALNNIITASVSSSYAIDPTAAQLFQLTVTNSTTFSMASTPGSGKSQRVVLELIMGSGAIAFTLAWSGITWMNGQTPNISQIDGDTTFIELIGVGTTWYANVISTLQESTALLASSSINLDILGNNVILVSGTSTINTIVNKSGVEKTLIFTDATPLTYSSNLVLPTGANITTAPGDILKVIGHEYDSVVYCTSYLRANGLAVLSYNLGVVTATTTVNLSANYNNMASGVGATLTSTTNGTLTLDIVTISVGVYVLIRNQTTQYQNGIYVCIDAGSGSTPWILERANYFNSPGQMRAGCSVIVLGGNLYTQVPFYLGHDVATVGSNIVVFGTYANAGSVSTVSGNIVNNADPVNPVVFSYVLQPCAVVQHGIGGITYTYNNGSSGIGATITNSGTQAALVIDSVGVQVGDRVLWDELSVLTHNGIYVVSAIGSLSTNWVLTRAVDYDTTADILFNTIVMVRSGAIYAGSSFYMSNNATITVGTSNIPFSLVGGNAFGNLAYQYSNNVGFSGGTMDNVDITTGSIVGTPIEDSVIGGITPNLGTFTSVRQKAENNIAAAGSTRTDAYQLTSVINNVTSSIVGGGVILPPAIEGGSAVVYNNSIHITQVYGNGSDTLNGTPGTTGRSLSLASKAVFDCPETGQWINLQDS